MSDKNKVIDTEEVVNKILNMIDSGNNIYLTDGTKENVIVLDNSAIALLRTNYIVKKEWGVNLVNG